MPDQLPAADRFEWDPDKADRNATKHGVSFDEASTVFDDPDFVTVVDDEHSEDEERYITIGMSDHGQLILVAHTERASAFASSAHAKLRSERRDSMQKPSDPEDYELRDDYDLSQMIVVPKGRFAPGRRRGRNVIVLAPDVAEAFPTDEAVNEALRLVEQLARIPRPKNRG